MSGSQKSDRERTIVRTSLIGIGANALLAAFKATVGLIANSIAVILDAVNNLSDALSSVITIIGTKLSARKPDKKHPLGYGRIEFLSAMVVSAIVLYAGITSGIESVKKLITPETPDYSPVTLIVIGTAVIVKFFLGRYVKSVGKRVESGALIASGSDAGFDALLSLSVLICAVIFLATGINLEAIVGILIAIVIIKSGIEMLLETLDEILGKRMEKEYLSEIRKTICDDALVYGAYDLILHSYGPQKYIGSVHIEVDETLTAGEIDVLERRVADRVFQEHGVMLTGIGIYARNTQNDEIRRLRTEITKLVMSHDGVLQMHGFFADVEEKTCTFDIILDYSLEHRDVLFQEITSKIRETYPEYTFHIQMDIDVL